MADAFLWPTTQKARREYPCDMCGEYILPGDLYRRMLWRTNKQWFVLKSHSWPDCPEGLGEHVEEIVSYSISFRAVVVETVVQYADGSSGVEPRTKFVPVIVSDADDIGPSGMSDGGDDIPF